MFRYAKSVVIENDLSFHRLGAGDTDVADEDLIAIQPGNTQAHSIRWSRLPLAPGLALPGVFPGQHAWIPLPTEGGHVTFAPT